MSEEKYPCPKCRGTGQWVGGYINQVIRKCHACNGRGYFKSSPEARANAREQRAARKAAQRAAYREANKEMFEYLESVKSWNSFAVSMLNAANQYGELTDNQKDAVMRMWDKHKARQVERADREANAPRVMLSRLLEMFNSAKDNGIKRPALCVDDIKIYPAPLIGKNAGCLYVKRENEYMGKITVDGRYIGKEAITELLKAIAKNPKGALSEHGRRTGRCSCCGRLLTNHASIDLGIGPICASRYGL